MTSKHSSSALVLTLLLATSAHASVVVPGVLQPGDMYHLAFVTQGSVAPFGMPDIEFYNQFVQAEAALNTTSTGAGMGVEWAAIASTPTDSARDNALVEAPVYLLDGTTLIANGFNDIWDGTIQNPINLNQFLNNAAANARTWTGSFDSGLLHPGFSLGTSLTGATGLAHSSDSDWISHTIAVQAEEFHIYALSEKLTVPNDAPVPEPGSVAVWLGLVSAIGLSVSHRRRFALGRRRVPQTSNTRQVVFGR